MRRCTFQNCDDVLQIAVGDVGFLEMADIDGVVFHDDDSFHWSRCAAPCSSAGIANDDRGIGTRSKIPKTFPKLDLTFFQPGLDHSKTGVENSIFFWARSRRRKRGHEIQSLDLAFLRLKKLPMPSPSTP